MWRLSLSPWHFFELLNAKKTVAKLALLPSIKWPSHHAKINNIPRVILSLAFPPIGEFHASSAYVDGFGHLV